MSVCLSYFQFPSATKDSTKEIYNQWRQNIETQKSNPFAKVCELHFRPDCFVRDLEAELTGRPKRKRLKGTIDKPMLDNVHI